MSEPVRQTAALKIDHVTIAGPDLKSLERAFAAAGMATDYGGPHSNQITHMSLLGFDDGSYIELLSMYEAGGSSPWWHDHIVGSAGPSGWCVQVPDVAAEARRMKELGLPVRGPVHMSRQRSDGTLIEWDLAFLGAGEPGTRLPFIIRDRTPRELRVEPSASVSGGLLRGVAMVVLGVMDLDDSIQLFQRVYGSSEPETVQDSAFGAKIASLTDAPLVLAAPLTADGWLAERLQRFGECPCAFLLATTDLNGARDRHDTTEPANWFGRRVSWFDPARLAGMRLGILGTGACG